MTNISIIVIVTNRYEEALQTLSHSDPSIFSQEENLEEAQGNGSTIFSEIAVADNNNSSSNSSDINMNVQTKKSVQLTLDRIKFLSHLYEKTKRPSMSEQLWTRAVRDGLCTYTDLGEMYVRVGKYDMAANSFEKELEILMKNIPGNVPQNVPENIPKNSSGNNSISEIENLNKNTIKNEIENEKITIKTLTKIEKDKIIRLHTFLGSLYSNYLGNVRTASVHFESILDLGGDMNKEMRKFYGKYSKELNEIGKNNENNEEKSEISHDSILNENSENGEIVQSNGNRDKIEVFTIPGSRAGKRNYSEEIIDLDMEMDNSDDTNYTSIKFTTENNSTDMKTGTKTDTKLKTNLKNDNDGVHIPTPFQTNNKKAGSSSSSGSGSSNFTPPSPSRTPRVMERAGFSLNRWVVKNERERVQTGHSEQEVNPGGGMKTGGMRMGEGMGMGMGMGSGLGLGGQSMSGSGGGGGGGNVSGASGSGSISGLDFGSGSGSASGGSGSGSGGESAFEAQVRMNEEFEDESGNISSDRGGRSSATESSILSGLSSNRRGRA